MMEGSLKFMSVNFYIQFIKVWPCKQRYWSKLSWPIRGL